LDIKQLLIEGLNKNIAFMILHDQIWLESINYPLKDLDAEKPPANPAKCLVETQNELVSCRVLTSTNHPRLTQ
jgi:hypothetical protein